MKPPLSDDSDDENCDDPIRLFDNNLNAVYFGTHPPRTQGTRDMESRWKFETIGNEKNCHPGKSSTLESPNDIEQTLEICTISECDISTLCVRLVDCGKFPWYFRKYTQQIMDKVVSNQCSDSENEVDVEGIADDSDDCFIVEDLQDVSNKIIENDQICIKTVQMAGPKLEVHKNNKCYEALKRRRDDREIQKALSIKNLFRIDLKRNQGLIGMKISQKMVTSSTLEVKTNKENEVKAAEEEQKDAMPNENYITAVDKTLDHIGTQLIPISEEKESNPAVDKTLNHIGTQLIPISEEKNSNPICQLKIHNNKEALVVAKPTITKSTSFQNVPVQFDISKISDKIIDNLMTKKINDPLSEAKPNSKVSNESLLNNPENKLIILNEKKITSKIPTTGKFSNSSIKLTSHVKDTKKTNKYKNDQIKEKNKASHSSLIGLLVTNKTKDDNKEIKCANQKLNNDSTQSKVTKIEKNTRKKIEKRKREPKSPILHCSTVPKKLKHEMLSKCVKSDKNSDLPKELCKIEQILDKLTNSNNCKRMQDNIRPKSVVPKTATVTKPLNVHTKSTLQKESCMKQDKTVSPGRDIQTKCLNIPAKLIKNCNDVSNTDFKTNNYQNTQCINENKNEQNLSHENRKVNVNKNSITAVSGTNPNLTASIINTKPTVCNSNIPTTTVVTPASGSKSVPSNKHANFPTTHRPHIPIHNTVPSNMCSNNIPKNNTNVPVQNRYASAIILKSNNHSNFQFEKHCEPPVPPVGPQKPMTVPSYIQSRFIDRQQPYPLYYPTAPSVRHQGYFPSQANSVSNQFRPPNGRIGQQQSNSMQNFYKGCWLPNNLAPPPPPPPPPPPNNPPRNCHDLNRTWDYYPQSASVNPQSSSSQNADITTQTKNSSIIGMNNDGLVKRINIIARPISKNMVTEKGVVEVEDLQISSPLEEPEVVATKTEMLRELDKLSFVDENINDFKKIYPASIINENKNENTLEVAIMSKKPGRFETLKLTMNQKDNCMRPEHAKGYSPPILPIPTYQKVLGQVITNSQLQNATPKIATRSGDPRILSRNETKPIKKRDFVKCCKRKLDNAWNDEESKRKDDAKKISIEEYKKRVPINDKQNKTICKEKYNNRLKIEYKYRENVDYSTETDLGYDSDSTVVL